MKQEQLYTMGEDGPVRPIYPSRRERKNLFWARGTKAGDQVPWYLGFSYCDMKRDITIFTWRRLPWQ